jgi:HD superfamily phosphodiesterase
LDAQLEGKTLDDYNNLKTICENLDNKDLDFENKEKTFINTGMEMNLNNLQIFNEIIKNSVKKQIKAKEENKKTDDVYYTP